jgi:hypothetical protein
MRSLLALVIAAISVVGCTNPAKSKPPVPAEPARAVAPAEVALDAKTAEQTPALPPTSCELRGRFTFADRTPASDVRLWVMGSEGDSERVRKYGQPEHWETATGTSNADGTFSIRFDPPGAYQFELNAWLPGWCDADWRWGKIEPGTTIDVGTVELVRSGSIRGRIVDAKGHALSTGWMVSADAWDGDPVTGRAATSATRTPSAATGEFLFDVLPAGRVRLRASSGSGDRIEGPVIDVRAGEESKADMTYSGPDDASRITIVTFTDPFDVFDVVPSDIRLSGAGIQPCTAIGIENSSQSFAFEDVPPGSYTVEIRDPRFKLWLQSGVRTGTTIDAHLRGSAAVSLRVLDELGRDVPRYELDVRFDKANFSPNTIRVLEKKKEPPQGGIFKGLIPRDQTLIVRADGYAPCEVAIPDLKAGEKRAAIAHLAHGMRVTGRVVVGAQKTALANMRVVLAPKRPSEDMHYLFDSDSPEAKEATSDAQGRFVFEEVPPGNFDIRASRGVLYTAHSELKVAPNSPVAEVEIALPAEAWLSGNLIGPAGASFENLRVLAIPVMKDEVEAARMHAAAHFNSFETAVPISDTGAFRIGQLPRGDVSVTLRMPDLVSHGGSSTSSSPGQSIELGTVTLSAEGDTTKEFDVRDQFPGRIAFRVRVNGQPAASDLVFLTNESPGSPPMSVSIQLDAHGFAPSSPFKPGKYVFNTLSIDGAWIDVSSAQRTLKAGESIDVDLDVQLLMGTLRVIDATTNAPLANGDIWLQCEGDNSGACAHTKTNPKGEAQLQLPLARFQVAAGRHPPYHFRLDNSVAIDWTTSGPVPTEVKLTPSIRPK